MLRESFNSPFSITTLDKFFTNFGDEGELNEGVL